MATPLCQCYQICVRRCSGAFPSSYLLLHNRPNVYRTRGVLACSSQVPQSRLLQVRYLSGERGSRKGFLGELLHNIKQELSKNKDMKDSIKKFREEAKKLEESDALKQARRKYKTIESETVKTSDVLKKKLGNISETVKEGFEGVSRTEIGKKIKDGMEEAAKTSAESVSKSGEILGKSGAFRAISQGMESVKQEIGDLGHIGPYRPPARLRKRSEFSSKGPGDDSKVFEANEEAMGVVLHKDSKWYQQWKDFKDNNMVFNRFFEMKMKYDESDNSLIRASRIVTDRMTGLIGGLFSKTEMSEVLTEILKADPSFDKDSFLKRCELDIIPNILEAMIRGELEVLKDWCYEATYSQLAHPIHQAKAMGLRFDSKILDIDNIDLAMGKMMDQGPVLIITFQAQLVMVIRNTKGEVVEGDPGSSGTPVIGKEVKVSTQYHAVGIRPVFRFKDYCEKVLRMMYVWALCRDQEELNPSAAWRLLDISASSTEQIL